MTSAAVLVEAPRALAPSVVLPGTSLEPVATRTIHLPPVRRVAAHGLSYLALGNVTPMVVFYSLFNLVNLRAALVGVLVWSLGLIAHRVNGSRRIEATLLLSTALMLVRITVTWCTGSALVFLVQPLISTFLTAAALLGSVAIRRPFTERVTRDYVPLPDDISGHQTIQSCFSRVSLIWGAAYLVNGTAAVWLLTHLSMGQFMVVSKTVGLSFSAAALLASLVLFVRTLRKHRIKLRFASV